MNTPTRTGKIARLPCKLRDRLNHRLQNGEPARTLIAWLNARPDVKAILKEHFDAQPIRHQNLSQWRHGGYQDWLLQQNSRDLSQAVTGDHAAWDHDHPPLPGALNHWLATHYTLITRRIVELAQTDPDASSRLLRQMTRDIATLQRADTFARREARQQAHQTFQENQAAERIEQSRQKTAAHEQWALHPDNLDRLRRQLNAAHMEREALSETVDWEGNTVYNNGSKKNSAYFTPPTRHPAPHEATPASHPGFGETGVEDIEPVEWAATEPDEYENECAAEDENTHADAHAAVSAICHLPSAIPQNTHLTLAPPTSAPSSAIPSGSEPAEENDQPSTSDILDHLSTLETRLNSFRTFRPPHLSETDAASIYFNPWFIRGQRIRDGLDPETGELPPSRRPSKLPPPVSESEAAVRRLLGENHFLRNQRP